MQNKKENKVLVAFDFDHTIIDDNSDIQVTTLCPEGEVPQDIKDLYSDKCWTFYMRAIFEHLHKNGISEEKIRESIENLPFTDGMMDLFKHLDKEEYDVIIISDSNSKFIQYALEHAKIDHIVSDVYTNPADFDDKGCLQIEFYHTQDWCELSTQNLCKGHILEEHVKKNSNTTTYTQIVYVGDGTNDLCPTLKLREKDYACPRKGFSLWKKLKKLGCLDGTTTDLDLKANILVWSSGTEIIDLLKNS